MSRAFLSAIAALTLAACGGPQTPPEPQDVGSLAPFATGEMAEFVATDSGAPAPALALAGADGAQYALADTMGEGATLLNLWATWCAPCIVEMPALNQLQADYSDRGLKVVAVNLDDTAQKGMDFYEQRGLAALEFHHDPSLIAPSLFDTASLPLTVVYDAQGRELGRTWGAPDWTSPEAYALIDAALAMGQAPAR